MINNHWQPYFEHEFKQTYMQRLRQFLVQQKSLKKVIYPDSKNVFKAFELTDLPDIKVVILGQDPYHGLGQAHGLSFSVPKTVQTPPSLKNIFKEINSDIGEFNFNHGNLENYARQGVLLLNSVLTVEARKPGSHANQGWETFTNKMIEIINQKADNIVFLLWGAYAKKKGEIIDTNKHLILGSPHPSPFSAYSGFLGNEHFSKANQYLKKHNIGAINWLGL